MTKFNHLDLFSGIGGFSEAAKMVWKDDYNTVAFCEKNEFCQELLKDNWPGTPIINSIGEADENEFTGIDLVTGGFPCQPFSLLGKRGGCQDDRYLWPEMFKIIQKTEPRWILAENVVGIIDMALDDVLFDLESAGYEAWSVIIPAISVGAQHIRKRIWIIAHAGSHGYSGSMGQCKATLSWEDAQEIWGENQIKHIVFSGPVAPSEWRQAGQEADPQPLFIRDDDGLLHAKDRIAALGNAIVPHVASVIFMGMKKIDEYLGQTGCL